MKQAILTVYPGEAWVKKVEKMKAGQIMAVYSKFLSEGKFNAKKIS